MPNFGYRDALVFIVCLIVSSFLWLLNSLEKKYTSKITIPVEYIDYPKSRQLTVPLPSKFDLIVDASGYTLLSHKIRLAFSPVVLSVQEMIDKNSNVSKFKYSILTISHKDEIEKQISNEIKILSINPDTLTLNFSTIISRKLKIVPDVNLTFNNQYVLQELPFTTPDSIVVTGPGNVVSSMKYVKTEPVTLTALEQSVSQSVQILPIRGVQFEEDEVELSIEVEQCTEVSLEVPIVVLNIPEGVQIKTFPAKVHVNGKVGLSKYKKIVPGDFSATIDYSRLSPDQSKIPVHLESNSPYLPQPNFSPKEVEFIIETNE